MRRNIAACYSEHAVKVSDSYCSAAFPHPHVVFSKFPSPTSPVSVSSTYTANISTLQNPLLIHLHWTSMEMGQSFTIKINSISHRILTGKGLKSFKSVNDSVISVFWDISEAQFDAGPEPTSGFYVVVTVDSEIGLLIGDERDKLVKLGILERKFDAQFVKFSLVSRTEEFSGDDLVFLTKARFSDAGSLHEILVMCGGVGGEDLKNQRLAVFVDKKQVVEVKRLRWNFRGNQTIFVDGSVVDMMWDVYQWLFRPEHAAATATAAFMFRRRSGLDSRLWVEEEKTKQERNGFSLLIRASNHPD
ncbi:hypothetical protein SDJN02_09264, partial [Cucurbita argyrosperma subsp. argyrosperma]